MPGNSKVAKASVNVHIVFLIIVMAAKLAIIIVITEKNSCGERL